MGEPTLFWRFRGWLAWMVLLPILYFVLGEKPLFCDLATDGCPLDADDPEVLRAYLEGDTSGITGYMRTK